MKRILFIGTSSDRSERIRGLLDGVADAAWSVSVVANAGEALTIMAGDEVVHAVVAEPQLWTQGSGTLLDELKERYPGVAPMCLSEPPASDAGAMLGMQSLGSVTSAESLSILLNRTHELHRLLLNDNVRRLVGGLEQLPSLPSTYWDLMQAASRTETTVSDISAIIQRDAAMSVKVLQLVNSSFFGLKSRVSSIAQAVSYLGIGLLKSLVLSAHVFSALDVGRCKVLSIERFQLYSIRVARLAQRMTSNKAAAEEAFSAGMIHNVGELVLAVKRPDEFALAMQRCAESNVPRADVERDVFGVTHPEVGAQLLANWGIPFSIVEVAAFHHEPSRVVGGDVEVLAAVHSADALVGIMTCGDPDESLDRAFLERAGLIQQLPRWRALVEKEVANWAALE